ESLALRSARRMHSIGSEPLAALRRHGLHPGPAVMVLPADDLARHALHAYEEFLDRRSVA
ncbi:MAG TPA: hypothetical protein VEL76_21765, partial [Gemmataceae bacterium]|nr:hypothetical protein [Gemmataceae bacterium]